MDEPIRCTVKFICYHIFIIVISGLKKVGTLDVHCAVPENFCIPFTEGIAISWGFKKF